MIKQTNRPLPKEWTDDRLIELFDHARDLGLNGNPGGYMLSADLFPFVGKEDQNGRWLRDYCDWDYEGMRRWVEENQEHVRISWQREVVVVY
jgi:hypothetical protein